MLGLGANLGDPPGQLREAVAALGDLLGDLRLSSVYRTEPVGLRAQPDFLNLVCVGESKLSPESLLQAALAIESRLGRVREIANGPRTVDIDLLDLGGRVEASTTLVLPHPRLQERAFVLAPLAEVAPEWRHPVLGATAAELLRRLSRPERVEPIGALDSLG